MQFYSEIILGFLCFKAIYDIFYIYGKEKDFEYLKRSFERFSNEFDRKFDRIAPEAYESFVEQIQAQREASLAKIKELETQLNVGNQQKESKELEIRSLELQIKLKEKEEFKIKQLIKLQEQKNTSN